MRRECAVREDTARISSSEEHIVSSDGLPASFDSQLPSQTTRSAIQPETEVPRRPFWIRYNQILLPIWGAIYIAIAAGMLSAHLSSTPMSCYATAWSGDCGPDGIYCLAGLPTGWTEARCASSCGEWNVNLQYRYRVYGTGPIYAGNSYICPAARHAGLIGQAGGPIRFRLTAAGLSRYDGGTANGVVSQPLGAFPAALELAPSSSGSSKDRVGLRWPILAVTLILLALFVALEPSNSWFYAVTLFTAFIYTQARAHDRAAAESFPDSRRAIVSEQVSEQASE
jgi:hypothetical protein